MSSPTCREPRRGKSARSTYVASWNRLCRKPEERALKTTLDDIEVAYTACGSGPAVVLVHGLAEDRSSWAAVQKALSHYRTFAYDLRGHGATTIGRGHGTLAQLGGDLLRFLDKISGPAACVGFSLGGTVVLWAAAQKSPLVTQAILAGTSSVVGRKAGEFFEQRIATLAKTREAFGAALRADTAAQLVTALDEVDKVTERRLAAVGGGEGYVNAARAMIGLVNEPLTPLVAQIACPVDVIGGEKDAFCPRKAADILVKALPSAAFHEIPDAGHLMSVDNPTAYAAAIETSLRRRAMQ